MWFVATPRRLLCLSSSSIALMPKGVAALASPIMLAAMLRSMALMAGLSGGSPGKSRRMTGLTSRARRAMSPASEATRIRPRKKAITPTRPIARSTAPRAEETTASVRARISPLSAAARIEARATTTKMPFSMRACRRPW